MSKKFYTITVMKEVAATPGQIWATWTTPVLYNKITGNHSTEIDFREGGTIKTQWFPDKPDGEVFVIKQIRPEQKLIYAWEGQEEYEVTVAIQPMGKMTEVRITQNCQDDPGWIENCLDGWAWILDSIEQYLQTGKGYANDEWSFTFGTHKIVKKNA